MSKIDELMQLAYDEYINVLHNDAWYQHILASMTLCLEFRYPAFKKTENGDYIEDGYIWKSDFWKKQYEEYKEYREEFHKELAQRIHTDYHISDIQKYGNDVNDDLKEKIQKYNYDKANYENIRNQGS